jgi:hypothetical protein
VDFNGLALLPRRFPLEPGLGFDFFLLIDMEMTAHKPQE